MQLFTSIIEAFNEKKNIKEGIEENKFKIGNYIPHIILIIILISSIIIGIIYMDDILSKLGSNDNNINNFSPKNLIY